MKSQMVARCTGVVPTDLIVNIGNAHIYEKSMHLAGKHVPWSFMLPLAWGTYDTWKTWAETEIELLSMKHVTSVYGFNQNIERQS